MIDLISSSESCCRCSWISMVWWWCGGRSMVFGAEVFKVSTSVWLSVVLSDLWLLYGGLWVVAGVVFERWWGLALHPLGMNLRPMAPFRLSFWVVFCGCFFKLTNGGCQYWVSTDTNECGTKTMNMTIRHVASGTEFLANQSARPGWGARGVYL
jgi:hypothetical protein